MNDYIELNINLDPNPGEDATDFLAGMLGDIGFESFVSNDSGLTAYIASGLWDESSVKDVIDEFPYPCEVSFTHEFIEGKDWNEEWEKNYFQPIVVGNQCVVHSSFHTDIPEARYDIVIDPKMAFGTGHHATTSLILDQLLSIDLENKSVIDMGTGTGILAILAAMRGAHPVTGIEIDPFAQVNAAENVALNGHSEIKVILGDSSTLEGIAQADVFIANINRNVITGDIDRYAGSLKPGGLMLLSGFYVEDIPVVMEAAAKVGLKKKGFTERDRWTCLQLERTE